ncbi:DnaB-like helicase N-terminal domain-containing protein [Streptomyces sp. SPB074]|uniref:DnaB-like helicase N-terminal domain-containing protein n=1 Tax=Streptomyces sp. (strain SPB074) TaxID=465543 RepID=UPI00017F1CB0|nr:DnaB-like helicase N-terminal domain-containing protein [Streptomyces sp. SPB074]
MNAPTPERPWVDPLLRAEQALLGAVLLSPSQLDRLSWLHPDDFHSPHHTALFAAAQAMAPAKPTEAQAEPVTLAWPQAILGEAQRRVRGLSAPYLHDLIASCPYVDHAPVYGRMVLEGSLHRSVLRHATATRQAAREVHRSGLDTALSTALHRVDALAEHLDAVGRRWGAPPRARGHAPAFNDAVHSPLNLPVEHERDLLAALERGRASGLEAISWLEPGDFAAYGDLFACARALAHRGEPVDTLTLTWEARRRDLLSPENRRRLDAVSRGPAAGSLDWLGERVLASGLLRAIDLAADRVQSMAGDVRYSPARLVHHGRLALETISSPRNRLEQARTGLPPAVGRTREERIREVAQPGLARARSRPAATSAAAKPSSHPSARSKEGHAR